MCALFRVALLGMCLKDVHDDMCEHVCESCMQRDLFGPFVSIPLWLPQVNVVYKYPVAPPATAPNEWPYRFSTAIAVTTGETSL